MELIFFLQVGGRIIKSWSTLSTNGSDLRSQNLRFPTKSHTPDGSRRQLRTLQCLEYALHLSSSELRVEVQHDMPRQPLPRALLLDQHPKTMLQFQLQVAYKSE